MAEMKIIIPMAGFGKRLLQLTRHKPKALVRLADNRLLDHVLNTFQGLENIYTLEYIFIIGYMGDQIKKYMQDAHPDKKVTYYVQEKLIGQSHAVYLAKENISGPILLTYCDTIIETDFSYLSIDSMDGVLSVQEVEDPRSHGVAVIGSDNLVTKLVEKPQTTENKSVLTGLYYFVEGKNLIKAIETQIQRGTSLNNEFYLADAINILLEDGVELKAKKVLQWLDAGTPESILETNAYLLRNHTKSPDETIKGSSNILINPVYIHESSQVENSIIGPNVSVGKNCVISGSILKNSIIDDDSYVTDVMLTNSLISKSCVVNGEPLQSITADNDKLDIFCSTSNTNGIEESSTP
jgi:glucose-1-phosphate thymidylyltransferase